MKIPFVDLLPQYLEIKDEIDQVIADVAMNTSFIGGKPVKEFEKSLADSFGLKYACGVSSGTAAIAGVLRSLKLGPEDEVITTAHTAFPTPEAIALAGGKVVFCDIDLENYNLDPKAVDAAITPKTKAILPVHLYGMPADLNALKQIADKHDLALIEDCAQAQGAEYEGRRVGAHGLAGCLSFFPSKNLGAWGDGGAVVTDDDSIAKFVRMYSNHGRTEKYQHDFLGANERLDALQAAILNKKIAKLDEWNARRRVVAGWYEELLAGVQGITLPKTTPGGTPIWHLYVVLVENRENFMKYLSDQGISTGLHYPLPLHLQPAFAYLGQSKGAFPVAERVTSECVSLPMYPHLEREQVEYVCKHVLAYFGQ